MAIPSRPLWRRATRLLPRARQILQIGVIALPTLAIAQSDLVRAPSEATPVTVVTPDFPAGAQMPEAGVRVDFIGTVLVNGEFRPQAITSEGDHPRFITAVSEVLTLWRFRPAADAEKCAPVDSEFRMSVWFEGSAAAPRVFVSRATRRPSKASPPIESIWTGPMSYFSGMEGQVVVLMRVTPDGEVKTANVRWGTPQGYFDPAALMSAKRTLITWKEPRPQADICMQREYLFCVAEGTPAVTFPACKRKQGG